MSDYCPTCHRLIWSKHPPLEIIFLRLREGNEITDVELHEFFQAWDEFTKTLPHQDKLEITCSEYGK